MFGLDLGQSWQAASEVAKELPLMSDEYETPPKSVPT